MIESQNLGQCTVDPTVASNRPPLWLWSVGVGGLIVTIFWYAALRYSHGGNHMIMLEHGELGNSFGPISALFSLATVLAALWSMELQRRELQAQSRRLDEQQALLEEQRTQFTRSADAHEMLAKAQVETVTAQERANTLSELAIKAQQASILIAKEGTKRSLEIELAQHWSTSCSLQSAIAQLVVAKETGRDGAAVYPGIRIALDKEIDGLQGQIDRETKEIQNLERRIGGFQ